MCTKCKRNIQSKAVFCDTGNHWIHYHCERLNKSDIECIENTSSNETYCCKGCKSESIKIPPASNDSTRSTDEDSVVNLDGKIIMPRFSHFSSPEKILEDEIYINCAVCDTVIRGTVVNCTQCDIECHLKCVQTNSIVESTCFCCIGMEEQLVQDSEGGELAQSGSGESGNNPVEHSHKTDTDQIQTVLYKESTTKQKSPLNKTSYVEIDISKPSMSKNIMGNEATKENHKMKEIKQTELRQKEQKLRKKEEDLKMREKLIEEHDSERVWFKSHIQKLEMKVNELEKSNNILKAQANMQKELPGCNAEGFKIGKIMNQTESLVQKIQEGVTGMVLRQVEAQFEKIEKMMNNQTYTLESENCNSQINTETQTENNTDSDDCFIVPNEHESPVESESRVKAVNNLTGDPLFFVRGQEISGQSERSTSKICKPPNNKSVRNEFQRQGSSRKQLRNETSRKTSMGAKTVVSDIF